MEFVIDWFFCARQANGGFKNTPLKNPVEVRLCALMQVYPRRVLMFPPPPVQNAITEWLDSVGNQKTGKAVATRDVKTVLSKV